MFEADGRLMSKDDIQVALLADLQEIQKLEAEELLEDVENKVGSSVSFELRNLMANCLKQMDNWRQVMTSRWR